MFSLIFVVVELCVATDNVFDIMDDLVLLREKKANPNNTFFSPLETYQVNAIAATEKTYPWIAKVIHSKTNNHPYMCTASCIHEGIFITASRCIYRLKVTYTSVLYTAKRLPVRAFVFPSKPTIQQFDDIGFIVIEKKANQKFNVVQLYPQNEVKRTDDNFKWFLKMKLAGPYKVVGYVMKKGDSVTPTTAHDLKHLTVSIQMELCWAILTSEKRNGFHVPCYHSCNYETFKRLKGKCNGYLAVEGAAIINDKTKKIFGVAIWGLHFSQYELPVGFSVVNSKAFIEDFECAKKIRNSKPKTGQSYQILCKK